ncbi:MAG: hypothetical protein NDF54_06610 [archaeon GB-1867-035]|nr:hypothetical protein [Candidatus Culexmicrobium profundum]
MVKSIKRLISMPSYTYFKSFVLYQLLPLFLMFLCVVLLSGFTYVAVEPPLWYIPMGSRIIFIAPYLDFQTVVESVVVLILILSSILGLILIQKSSKILYDIKYANTLLAIGSIMFIASFLVLQYFLAKKIGWI